MQNRMSVQEPNFSEPWHMSDAMLLVEGERFHIHRSTLSMCSLVFEKVFTADFREKTQMEIQLPDKKVSEIREMLLVIYPNSLKPIAETNVYFLLSLADEYQMGKVTERCVKYLLQRQKSKSESIVFLVLAQGFNLKSLRDQCIEIAKEWPLSKLKAHQKYKSVSPENRRELAEKRLEQVEVSCERYLNQFAKEHCCKLNLRCDQPLEEAIETIPNKVTSELAKGIYNIVLHE